MPTVEELWETLHQPFLPSQQDVANKKATTTKGDIYAGILHNEFTCVVNGSTSGPGAMPLKDLVFIMTSSFTCAEHTRTTHVLPRPDVLYTSGTWRLRHSRTFLSWAPTNDSLLIDVPYSALLVASGSHLRSVHIVTPYTACLLRSGMPDKLRSVLASRDSMRMFCSLRGIGVKPEIITYNALLGVAVRTASWGQALAIK